jgi:hypothetical protein
MQKAVSKGEFHIWNWASYYPAFSLVGNYLFSLSFARWAIVPIIRSVVRNLVWHFGHRRNRMILPSRLRV